MCFFYSFYFLYYICLGLSHERLINTSFNNSLWLIIMSYERNMINKYIIYEKCSQVIGSDGKGSLRNIKHALCFIEDWDNVNPHRKVNAAHTDSIYYTVNPLLFKFFLTS